jgi:hypothetical protein
MEKRISKRLKRLERAVEKDIFQDAWPFAAAYYLGGANNFSKFPQAFAKALGYSDDRQLCQEFAKLIKGESSDVRTRAHKAQRQLLAIVRSHDRASLAEAKDAIDRIVRTLPEDWRAEIKSADRESREAEAIVNQTMSILNDQDRRSGRNH